VFHVVQILTNAFRVNLKLTIDLRSHTLKATELDIFDSISLDEMNNVSLMKRTDTKFVINERILSSVLESIKEDYRILQIGENRLMTYNSYYFDTPKNGLYTMHHNGRAGRIKVRMRNYVESDLCFLEVKVKDKKGDTVKSRIRIDGLTNELDATANEFISVTTQKTMNLTKSIENQFNRFTLVNTENKERVTVDVGLSFDGTVLNENLVIVELKQEKLNRNSSLYTSLKAHGIGPFSISKYCIGMAATHPELKQNLFKSKFLKINKLTT